MKKTLLWVPLIGLVSAFVVVAVGGLSGRTRFLPRPVTNAVRQMEAPGRIAVFSGGLDERMAATICDLSGKPNPQVLLFCTAGNGLGAGGRDDGDLQERRAGGQGLSSGRPCLSVQADGRRLG